MGVDLTPEEVREVFGDNDPRQYEEEAKQRWGDTAVYKESNRRTSGYSKEDWVRHGAESETVEARVSRCDAARLGARKCGSEGCR